jgi:exosortase
VGTIAGPLEYSLLVMNSATAARVSFPLPWTFVATLLLSAGFVIFLAWDQSHWWISKEDYGFGWLAPIFVAYVVHDRWLALKRHNQEIVSAAVAEPANSADTSHAKFDFAQPLVIAGVLVGGLFFAIGALYRAAAGPSFAGTFALTLGTATLGLSAIYIMAPARRTNGTQAMADRRFVAALFIFPLVVWSVSAPMITSVENNLNVFLMKQVTATVFFVFDTLGLPLEQRGNVLILPTGTVGVAEACSGIRSLTGCLFSGSFLAAIFLKSWWRKSLLVVAALFFAFLANLLRSIFLTSWAYSHGADSIEGTLHDLSGYAVLALAVLGLMGVLPALTQAQHESRPRRQAPL